jgi:hypothetical protein
MTQQQQEQNNIVDNSHQPDSNQPRQTPKQATKPNNQTKQQANRTKKQWQHY